MNYALNALKSGLYTPKTCLLNAYPKEPLKGPLKVPLKVLTNNTTVLGQKFLPPFRFQGQNG